MTFSIFHFKFSDGPVFKTRPKSIEADNGSTIVLTCDVTGNPTPDILWIHEPNDKVKLNKMGVNWLNMCHTYHETDIS